ncbi:ABC transporter permease [Kitasatospora sp. NPDC004669]|uniref:ABC transporter permease n=1 Tax=Kitasatospora sp. NPDC004669 TaxID=3154555 RepID=UPI0033A04385
MTSPQVTPRVLRSSVLGLGVSRGLAEIRVYVRDVQAVCFGLALPVGLMLLFGTLFQGEVTGTHVPVRDLIVAGVCASAIMSVAFGSLGSAVAADMSDGTMKRILATPFPLASYFIAKVVQAAVLAFVDVGAVLLVAVLWFGFRLPVDPARWVTFAWVCAMGVAAACAMGFLVGSLIKDPKKSSGAIQFPFIFLQFLSGVYYSFRGLPSALQHVGALFPLKWMAQGMRAALLPDGMRSAEVAGSFELERSSAILLLWVCVLLPLCFWSVRRRIRGRS